MTFCIGVPGSMILTMCSASVTRSPPVGLGAVQKTLIRRFAPQLLRLQRASQPGDSRFAARLLSCRAPPGVTLAAGPGHRGAHPGPAQLRHGAAVSGELTGG